MAAVDFEEGMEAESDGDYKPNLGFQYPGTSYYTEAGKELLEQHDIAKAKQLLEQSGYKGEKVVLLTNKDYPSLYNSAPVVSQELKAIGINTELQAMVVPMGVMPKVQGVRTTVQHFEPFYNPRMYNVWLKKLTGSLLRACRCLFPIRPLARRRPAASTALSSELANIAADPARIACAADSRVRAALPRSALVRLAISKTGRRSVQHRHVVATWLSLNGTATKPSAFRAQTIQRVSRIPS